MTIKTINFEIFSDGSDDIIDITPKVLDFIKDNPNSVAFISSKEKESAIIQINQDEFKNFINYLNQTLDNVSNSAYQIQDCIKYKNILKSMILGKIATIDNENLINNNEKILFIDFSKTTSKKQITIKILF